MPQTHKTPNFQDFNPSGVAVLKVLSDTAEGSKAETTTPHGLGYIPTIVIPVADAEGNLWISKAADITNVYIKGETAIAYKVYVG
jgi:hypothetical protein